MVLAAHIYTKTFMHFTTFLPDFQTYFSFSTGGVRIILGGVGEKSKWVRKRVGNGQNGRSLPRYK